MPTLDHLPYLFAMLLFVIGLYAIVAKKNLVKLILGLIVIEYAVNLFLLLLGYRGGGVAPILTRRDAPAEFLARTVDPLPQALILTAIVIGLGTLALVTALALRLYDRYGTFDITEIKKLKG
ncbi:NADH-quinone oxidoreductase subunit K [bacterium]|nr:NADH-quinone oxidoreductase subunit K [bacterium]